MGNKPSNCKNDAEDEVSMAADDSLSQQGAAAAHSDDGQFENSEAEHGIVAEEGARRDLASHPICLSTMSYASTIYSVASVASRYGDLSRASMGLYGKPEGKVTSWLATVPPSADTAQANAEGRLATTSTRLATTSIRLATTSVRMVPQVVVEKSAPEQHNPSEQRKEQAVDAEVAEADVPDLEMCASPAKSVRALPSSGAPSPSGRSDDVQDQVKALEQSTETKALSVKDSAREFPVALKVKGEQGALLDVLVDATPHHVDKDVNHEFGSESTTAQAAPRGLPETLGRMADPVEEVEAATRQLNSREPKLKRGLSDSLKMCFCGA